ncbi:MAG TPA: bifunctional DNA-formamidopyrimidine glycosylase/DNA-(apurinic or apyrimidinic site) lyase [Candidatus Sulfotelmatobacter sp.]|nr:bifunctional DNA-formamidopyrimidine glycosylase/DNA-(apurinic or apyrimidinic site) lyase [Candidatus Sulfotelmatobacter sp.]
MPELPEVETVCRGLAEALEGRRLARIELRRHDLRWPLPERFVERLQGRAVRRVRRRAKYIVMDTDGAEVLLAHLGMSGKMLVEPPNASQPPLGQHDHVVFTTDHGVRIAFNDARRFGMLDLWAADALDRHPLLKDLGPEPLGNDFSAPVLSARLAGKRTPIKAALLDQRVVAGLGNIYVSEALFRAGISPRRSAHTVAGTRAERLVPAIKMVLQEAIAAGGSSLRDYVQASGELGCFQHHFDVYDREGQPCQNCNRSSVRRIVQSGRSSFFCPTCQR